MMHVLKLLPIALATTGLALPAAAQDRIGGLVAPRLEAPRQPSSSTWQSDTSYDETRREMQRIQDETASTLTGQPVADQPACHPNCVEVLAPSGPDRD